MNFNSPEKGRRHLWLALAGLAMACILIIGTVRNPNFWKTPDQRGDALLRQGRFKEAAEAYRSPFRRGVAQYRNGDFEAAARTFAQVPGANGAYNQGNAWLMHGNYKAAIESYQRALGFQPGWKEAEENKALAVARQKRLEAAGGHAEQEEAEAYSPDEVVYGPKGERGKPINEESLSNEALQATWLRRVQTTPADFLRVKFAYQAEQSAVMASPPRKNQ